MTDKIVSLFNKLEWIVFKDLVDKPLLDVENLPLSIEDKDTEEDDEQ